MQTFGALCMYILLSFVDSAAQSDSSSSPQREETYKMCDLLAGSNGDLEQRCAQMLQRLSGRGFSIPSSPLSLRVVLARHASMQTQMLRQNSSAARWLLCEPYGGIGNMIAALLSCFLVSLASQRARCGLLVSWEGLGTKRPWSPPYEAPLGEFLLPPFEWSLPAAALKNQALRDIDPYR